MVPTDNWMRSMARGALVPGAVGPDIPAPADSGEGTNCYPSFLPVSSGGQVGMVASHVAIATTRQS